MFRLLINLFYAIFKCTNISDHVEKTKNKINHITKWSDYPSKYRGDLDVFMQMFDNWNKFENYSVEFVCEHCHSTNIICVGGDEKSPTDEDVEQYGAFYLFPPSKRRLTCYCLDCTYLSELEVKHVEDWLFM